jgi:uncharacterized membrane protein
MTWLQRYRLRNFLRSSLWLVPLGSLVLALGIAPLLRQVDAWTRWRVFGFSPDGARAVLGALITSTFTFTVFVFSIILLVVQLASAQLTPRIIGEAFRDRRIKFSLGIFLFTFIYAIAVLGRVEDTVPQLPVAMTIVLSLVSIGTFLYLVDYVGKALRPVSVLTGVAAEGLRVIASIYPQPSTEVDTAQEKRDDFTTGAPTQTIDHLGTSAVVLAFDVVGLMAVACRTGCIIELVPQVGDFVATGEPLFRVFHGAGSLDGHELRRAVAFGPERTMQQDPAFAFRIIVDIAAKALSPAINDPTTAVLAIDQLHRLLRQVGRRRLSDAGIRDETGQLRLLVNTPNWDDYLHLAVTEMRHFGASSIQVTRRLRAMLDQLLQVLPPHRHPTLQQELRLLQNTVERAFETPEDRTLANTGDYQGLGGGRQL